MEEERGEVGGGEREREVHAAAALVVLAPETRRTQRNCPGSPRWFTAARRRDKPSTAARKSAPRIRTYSDSSKLHLRFISFHFKKKKKNRHNIPGNSGGGGGNQRSVPASLPADRCLCSATDRTPDRWLSWTNQEHLFIASTETFILLLIYLVNLSKACVRALFYWFHLVRFSALGVRKIRAKQPSETETAEQSSAEAEGQPGWSQFILRVLLAVEFTHILCLRNGVWHFLFAQTDFNPRFFF